MSGLAPAISGIFDLPTAAAIGTSFKPYTLIHFKNDLQIDQEESIAISEPWEQWFKPKLLRGLRGDYAW